MDIKKNEESELKDLLEKCGVENSEEYLPSLIETKKSVLKESEKQFKRLIKEAIKMEKKLQELTNRCNETLCRYLRRQIDNQIEKLKDVNNAT